MNWRSSRPSSTLDSLQVKVDYLTNLMRSGKAQVLGSDPDGLADAPWAAAIRASRIEAQEEERMRLAREVHDGPAQVLANAILDLEYCELVAGRAPQELGPELQRLRTMMREGLVEVRRFMFDLRPTTLATMGLERDAGPLRRGVRAGVPSPGPPGPAAAGPADRRQHPDRPLPGGPGEPAEHPEARRGDGGADRAGPRCPTAACGSACVDDGKGFDRQSVPAGHALGRRLARAWKSARRCWAAN